MKDMNGKINDERLEEVNGGAGIMDALFDKRKNNPNIDKAIKDDHTMVQSRFLAGEASKTEKDPMGSGIDGGISNGIARNTKDFGNNFGAGSGLA